LTVVVLLGALMLRRQVRVHRWLLAAFAPLILLLLLRLLFPVDPGVAPVGSRVATAARPAVRVAEGVLVAATILTSPVVLWVVARLLAPDYFVLPGRRVKTALGDRRDGCPHRLPRGQVQLPFPHL
jgi:hypothetical protein